MEKKLYIGKDSGDHPLAVNVAKPKAEGGRGGGGKSYGGGSRGYGGGGRF